jgi:hypothetical protein
MHTAAAIGGTLQGVGVNRPHSSRNTPLLTRSVLLCCCVQGGGNDDGDEDGDEEGDEGEEEGYEEAEPGVEVILVSACLCANSHPPNVSARSTAGT